MDKVRKSLSVLPWCQSFWTAMVPPPCSSEVAVWLLWENRCVQSRLRQTNAMGLKLCWLINTECIWLRCDHHFSSVCRFDLNSVKPNSHCVPNMRLWVSQNQSTTLHTKITILYKAKSGGVELSELHTPQPAAKDSSPHVHIENSCHWGTLQSLGELPSARHPDCMPGLARNLAKVRALLGGVKPTRKLWNEVLFGGMFCFKVDMNKWRQDTVHLISGKCAKCLKTFHCTTSRPYQ